MPEYVAVKSPFYDMNFLVCIVLCILGVIPGVIYIIYHVIEAKHNLVEFYSDKYVRKSGVFNTVEKEIVFMGVLSVTLTQPLAGKILGYGTVTADVAGKHDLSFAGVKEPNALKDYLLTRKIGAGSIRHLMVD